MSRGRAASGSTDFSEGGVFTGRWKLAGHWIGGPAAAYLLLAVMIAWLLGAALSGRERLAFRDTSHFYTPLYEYVASRQRQDFFSLWNPHDLCGLPLAGETSTAVFYPPRWVVYALAPSPESAIAWYAALHLFWAAIAVHAAARVAGAGPLGSAIAILTYPLAGPVLFSVNNVPFLVGASWLPLAIAGTVRLLRQPNLRWLAVTSVAFAAPTLGGDPQTTVHALMVVVPLLGIRAAYGMMGLAGRRTDDRLEASRTRDGLEVHRTDLRLEASRTRDGLEVHRTDDRLEAYPTSGGRKVGRTVDGRQRPALAVVAALILSALIAAPQLAASLDWARQTRLLETADAAGRYDFDVPPWHWAELLIPEASGRLFPVFTRISQALPRDGRIWVTTLYAGLIPLVLVIDRIGKRSRRFEVWDVLLPLGLLFSMAGPYEWLAIGVPGYSSFRYPGKWLSFVSLGMAMIAARQATEIVQGKVRGMQQTCLFVAATTLSAAGAAVFAGGHGAVVAALEALSLRDLYWGPLAVSLAFEQIAWSALGVAAIACGLWLSLRHTVVAPPLLLALIAVDMGIAARPQIATIDRVAEASLIEDRDRLPSGRSMRVSRAQSWPASWANTIGDRERLLWVAASERGTSFGRWHLSSERSIFNTATSLRPQRIEALWRSLGQLDLPTSDASTLSWQRLEAWLGITNRLIVSAATQLADQKQIATAHDSLTPLPASQVRWDHDWRTIPRRTAVDVGDMAARLAEVVGKPDHGTPLVETDAPRGSVTKSNDEAPTAQVAIVSEQPERIQIRVDATFPGLLTLKRFQDGNWQAEIQSVEARNPKTEEVQAVAVDYLFLGAFVPAGRSSVTFVYQPKWLDASVVLATVGSLLVVLLLVIGNRRPQAISLRV